MYYMSPGEGGKQRLLPRVPYPAFTASVCPAPLLIQLKKTPNQALFTGKQGVLAQPFNTHLKPGKGILARAVKCSELGPA